MSATDDELLNAFFTGHMSAYVSVRELSGMDPEDARREGNYVTMKMSEDPAVRMEILEMLREEEPSGPRTINVILD